MVLELVGLNGWCLLDLRIVIMAYLVLGSLLMSVLDIFGTRFYFVNVMDRLAGLGISHA